MQTDVKIMIILMLSLMMASSVSALSIYAPTIVKLNDNFDMKFADYNSVVALEMTFPDGIEIVSDTTGGIIKDGVYRTSFSGATSIILRATKTGILKINGRYTEGSGIIDFSKTISVETSQYDKVCPICPAKVDGQCINGKRTDLIYECGILTDYICKMNVESVSCTDNEACVEDWVCVDDMKIGYQSYDCTKSQVSECSYGCDKERNVCKANPITGAVVDSGSTGEFILIRWFRSFVEWLNSIFSNIG